MVKAQTWAKETEGEETHGGLCGEAACEQAVENWLHTCVAAAYDALKAEPSRGVSVERLRARLALEHARAKGH